MPLVKASQVELGEARANELVRKALNDLYRGYGKAFWDSRDEQHLGNAMASAFASYARHDALDHAVQKQSPDACDINVTTCRYTEFFKQLGEPDLGFLLVCSADFALADGFGSDIALKCAQTMMQGASHCEFRYRRRPRGD